MKHDLQNKEIFRFALNATSNDITDLHRELDKYLVAIFPMTTVLKGRNPYLPAVLERGLPAVLTVNAAEGMCEDCHDLITKNPMDPFDSVPKNFPFLVSNINEGELELQIFTEIKTINSQLIFLNYYCSKPNCAISFLNVCKSGALKAYSTAS